MEQKKHLVVNKLHCYLIVKNSHFISYFCLLYNKSWKSCKIYNLTFIMTCMYPHAFLWKISQNRSNNMEPFCWYRLLMTIKYISKKKALYWILGLYLHFSNENNQLLVFDWHIKEIIPMTRLNQHTRLILRQWKDFTKLF